MIKCPNKNLPEWKELEQRVPNKCYLVWDKNNGNGMEKAPNGANSILYNDLKQHYKNDKQQIFETKSQIYTTNFVAQNPDINGEPDISQLLPLHYAPKQNTKNNTGYAIASELKTLSNINAEVILSVFSKSTKDKYLQSVLGMFGGNVLSNINIVFDDNIPNGGTMMYNGKTNAIHISPIGIESSTKDYVIGSYAHEIIHAYTAYAYENNVNGFRDKVDKQYQKYSQYTFDKSNRATYGFKNAHEFVAEIMTNPSFVKLLSQIDAHKSIFSRILDAIVSLFATKQNSADIIKRNVEDIINFYNSNNSIGNTESILFTTQESTAVDIDNRDRTRLYDRIEKGLKSRLQSVKKYQNQNPLVQEELKSLINKLSKNDIESSVLLFIQHAQDSVDTSLGFIQNKNADQVSSRQLVQLSKDYVDFYKPLIDQIRSLLETTDMFKDNAERQSVSDKVVEIDSKFSTLNNKFKALEKAKARKLLVQYMTQKGTPQNMIDDVLNWIYSPNTDTSAISYYIGMSSNSSSPILGVMSNMLRNVQNNTQRKVLEKGLHLVKILNKAKAEHGVNVQKMLYEKDKDGNYTGFKVSDRNKGQYIKDRKLFIDNLALKLKLQKDENGAYVLPEDENIQQQWYNGLNDFYIKHAERRYTIEYYKLRTKMLSKKTVDALDEIQDAINQVENKATIKGVFHINLLEQSDYSRWLALKQQKSRLADEFNLDGTDKTGDDLIIAQELTKFNEIISAGQSYSIDQAKFESDRQAIIAKYGENSNQYKLWLDRSTKETPPDEFYDKLNSLERATQSEEYNKLYKLRKRILDTARDPKTGTVIAYRLSDRDKKRVIELDQQLDQLRVKAVEDPNQLKFHHIASIEYTEEYSRDFNTMQEQDRLGNHQAFKDWFDQNHYVDKNGRTQAASYYTQMKPAKEYVAKQAPASRYSKMNTESKWLNPNYDESGASIQPSKKLYDNTTVYNKIMADTSLKKLYEAIDEVLAEGNSMLQFMHNIDQDKMPQIPARLLQVLSRKSSLVDKLGYVVEDIVSTKDDDTDYVKDVETMPNGDPVKMVPTRYITMLKDPNNIATDAVGAVLQYYEMACNFGIMSEIKDDVELLLSLLKNAEIHTKDQVKKQGSSNVFKQAQLLVDKTVYGRKVKPIKVKIGRREINISKISNMLQDYVRKVNLHGNLGSIFTSLVTDTTNTVTESKLGRHFDADDLSFAIKEFQKELPKIIAGIGDPTPKGVLPYLFMLNQIVKDNKELFERLDQSSTLRSLNQHFWYMGYTQSDYTVKSHTILAVYHSYRFVKDKGFMNKQQFINEFYSDDRKTGEAEFKKLTTTLKDAYIKKKDGDIGLDPKYVEYVSESLLNDVKNKITVISKRIDGTLTDIDKSAVHANSLASWCTMHKNFMITALTDRLKKKHYSFDLNCVEQGYYRSFVNMLKLSKDGGNILKQLQNNYKNMEDYERYGVQKVLIDIAFATAAQMTALILATITDGDDDLNNWLMQMLTYTAMRSAFELRTAYNPTELIGLFKSPSAGYGWFENVNNTVLGLLNPMGYVKGDGGAFKTIDRGVYKGMPLIFKNAFKLSPFKNYIEYTDPKAKRMYLENQLTKL